MKAKFVIVCLVTTNLVCCAAPFRNLNFDGADTSNLFDSGGIRVGYATDMIPGWEVSPRGLPPRSEIPYNTFPAGPGFETLADASNSQNYPVAGSYTLYLSGMGFSQNSYTPYLLTQSGDIPLDAKSIRFTTFGAPYQLSVNGVSIALQYDYVPGETNPFKRQASVMGDISPFAGQSAQLQFSTALGADGGFIGGLDEIYFSTQPIPEPSTWLLGGLCGLVIVFLRRSPVQCDGNQPGKRQPHMESCDGNQCALSRLSLDKQL